MDCERIFLVVVLCLQLRNTMANGVEREEENQDGTITTGSCDPSTEGSRCPVGFLLEGSKCVPRRECACFWVDEDRLIPNGQSSMDEGCTVNMSCENNRLTRTEIACSPQADCVRRQDGERRCRCQDGYGGDGHSCVRMTDCQDIFDQGNTATGVYAILPEGWTGPAFNVSCNMTRGGGWTVFQRRIDGSEDFYRNWTSYKAGFGAIEEEHWLGNEKLFYITNQRNYELGVDHVSNSPYGGGGFQTFRTFRVNNEADSYRLDTGGLYKTNGKAFSTFDRDNDGCDVNCAEGHRGGWWYTDEWCTSVSTNYCYRFVDGSSYNHCTVFNPNGVYREGNGDPFWFFNGGGHGETAFWFGNCDLQFIELKIRPTSEIYDGFYSSYYMGY